MQRNDCTKPVWNEKVCLVKQARSFHSFNIERDGYAAKLGIIRGTSAKLFQIQHFFHAFELPSFHLDTTEDNDHEPMSSGTIMDEDLLKPLQLRDDEEFE